METFSTKSPTNEELVSKIQNGECDCLPVLWEQIEKFVAMQAGRCARALDGYGGVTEEDLYQTGYLAFTSAVDTFDEEKGMSFIGWLAFALKTAFAEAGGYRTKKRDPLNLAVSLDTPLDDEGDATVLGDLQEDPNAVRAFEDVEHKSWLKDLRTALETALQRLPEAERDAVEAKYFHNKTYRDIAIEASVYPETVRQRQRKGLRHLAKQRALLQFLEWRTSYYSGVGVGTFQRTGDRTVETIVLKRERLTEQWIERNSG